MEDSGQRNVQGKFYVRINQHTIRKRNGVDSVCITAKQLKKVLEVSDDELATCRVALAQLVGSHCHEPYAIALALADDVLASRFNRLGDAELDLMMWAVCPASSDLGPDGQIRPTDRTMMGLLQYFMKRDVTRVTGGYLITGDSPLQRHFPVRVDTPRGKVITEATMASTLKFMREHGGPACDLSSRHGVVGSAPAGRDGANTDEGGIVINVAVPGHSHHKINNTAVIVNLVVMVGHPLYEKPTATDSPAIRRIKSQDDASSTTTTTDSSVASGSTYTFVSDSTTEEEEEEGAPHLRPGGDDGNGTDTTNDLPVYPASTPLPRKRATTSTLEGSSGEDSSDAERSRAIREFIAETDGGDAPSPSPSPPVQTLATALKNADVMKQTVSNMRSDIKQTAAEMHSDTRSAGIRTALSAQHTEDTNVVATIRPNTDSSPPAVVVEVPRPVMPTSTAAVAQTNGVNWL